jgi:hypothetical protein
MYGVALLKLTEHVFDYLVQERALEPRELAPALLLDYQRPGRSDVPLALREHLPTMDKRPSRSRSPRASVLARQARHME